MCSGRGGRSYEAASKKKYRQYVRRSQEFNFKSAEDRFPRDAMFREQMIRNGWRTDTSSRVDRDTKEYLTPGHRSHQERKKSEGYYDRDISAAGECETFSWASKGCPARNSASDYWKKFN